MQFVIDLEDLEVTANPEEPKPADDDDEPGYYPMLISAE